MANNIWAAMGFDDELGQSVGRINPAQVLEWTDPDGFEYVTEYLDPSGVSLCLFNTEVTGPQETFALRNPHLASVETFQVTPGFVAVDLLDDKGQLDNRFLVAVDDPQMYPSYPMGAIGELARFSRYQLGAVAQDVTVYDSVADWEARTEPLNDEGLRMGPRFVTSPWLFALTAGDAAAEDARSISIFVAVCEDVETARNELTGREWYRIEADCGFPCTLALPIDASPAPRVGSVIDGKAFLTGTTGIWQDARSRPAR